MRSSSKTYFVYILAGKSGVLYAGITSYLLHRVADHRQKKMPGFTQRYGVTKLVWFEPARRANERDRAREADKILAAIEEDCLDRVAESRLA